MGTAPSQTIRSLGLAGEKVVQEPAKPRLACWGTGTLRAGLAKRDWRAVASRSARSRASSAWDGCIRDMV